MDKEALKNLICDSIDLANEKDISFYSKEYMYSAVSEYGGVIYKPSGRKEISINIIIDKNK